MAIITDKIQANDLIYGKIVTEKKSHMPCERDSIFCESEYEVIVMTNAPRWRILIFWQK